MVLKGHRHSASVANGEMVLQSASPISINLRVADVPHFPAQLWIHALVLVAFTWSAGHRSPHAAAALCVDDTGAELIYGWVTNQAGDPLEGCQARVIDLLGCGSMTTDTDEDGYFEFDCTPFWVQNGTAYHNIQLIVGPYTEYFYMHYENDINAGTFVIRNWKGLDINNPPGGGN